MKEGTSDGPGRPVQWPTTVSEAVSALLTTIGDEVKDYLASCDEADIWGLHFTLGMWIRNNYGLWQGNKALLESCRAFDPDGASMVIIRALWQALHQGKPEPGGGSTRCTPPE